MPGLSFDTPSLEHLLESEDLGIEVLHPGGLALTVELARLCHIGRGTRVLDVACGTGESACRIAGEFAARITGIDMSARMLLRARSKARERGLAIRWVLANAQELPFSESSFDAAICECTLCHLDKVNTLREMLSIVRPGGFVGIHDLCWRPHTPDALKLALLDLEEEAPVTFEEWFHLMQEAGLASVELYDRSHLLPRWFHDTRAQLGISGYLGAGLKVLKRWGVRGLRRVLSSERLFQDPHLGYVLLVGQRPA